MKKTILSISIALALGLVIYWIIPAAKTDNYASYSFTKLDATSWEKISANCRGTRSPMCIPTSCVTQQNSLYYLCRHEGVLYSVQDGLKKVTLLCANESNGCKFMLGGGRCSAICIN